ncbi:MAG: O-succinylhomoserine sulfhydrylase [Pseudomonadota bacterium]
MTDKDSRRFDTLAIREGELRTELQSHGDPVFLTSSFAYRSAAEAAARFAGTDPGYIYSRFTNPTVASFEQRLAALEGGEQCVAFASGMAAILATFAAFLQQGDHLVCSRNVFGTIPVLLTKYFGKFGVAATFVDATDYAAWEQAITPKTKLLFVESPSNPLGEIADIRRLAAVAKKAGAKFVVDNCFCTPALQKPLALGADIVLHSATKYIDGQGRCLGGAVVGNKADMAEVFGFLRSAGPTMSPFNAWVFLKGLETLRIRMEAHSRAALDVAQWLRAQPGVTQVFYAGLPDSPHHALATAQQRGLYGGVLSFRVKGGDGEGRAAAWRFIDATQLLSITANLGDVRSTITHPASTTHGRVSEEERARMGVTENLIRVSVGLEDVADIKADLARGLAVL